MAQNELLPEEPGYEYSSPMSLVPLRRKIIPYAPGQAPLELAVPGFARGIVNDLWTALTAPANALTGQIAPEDLPAVGMQAGAGLALLGAGVPSQALSFGSFAMKPKATPFSPYKNFFETYAQVGKELKDYDLTIHYKPGSPQVSKDTKFILKDKDGKQITSYADIPDAVTDSLSKLQYAKSQLPGGEGLESGLLAGTEPNYELEKIYDKAGVKQWKMKHPAGTYDFAQGPEGTVYAAGPSVTGGVDYIPSQNKGYASLPEAIDAALAHAKKLQEQKAIEAEDKFAQVPYEPDLLEQQHPWKGKAAAGAPASPLKISAWGEAFHYFKKNGLTLSGDADTLLDESGNAVKGSQLTSTGQDLWAKAYSEVNEQNLQAATPDSLTEQIWSKIEEANQQLEKHGVYIGFDDLAEQNWGDLHSGNKFTIKNLADETKPVDWDKIPTSADKDIFGHLKEVEELVKGLPAKGKVKPGAAAVPTFGEFSDALSEINQELTPHGVYIDYHGGGDAPYNLFVGSTKGGKPQWNEDNIHIEDKVFNEYIPELSKMLKNVTGGKSTDYNPSVESAYHPSNYAKPTAKSSLAKYPKESMREYTPAELDWEYSKEYEQYTKPILPDAFKSKEDFLAKYERAPLVHLTAKQLENMDYATVGPVLRAKAGVDKMQIVKDMIGTRRDVDAIKQAIESGKTAPPIVLMHDNGLRILGGNTRLMTGVALGKSVPVKLIDVRHYPLKHTDPFDPAEPIFGPERAKNFKAWFGDSKAVDAMGRPMVFYHSTQHHKLESLDPEKAKATAGREFISLTSDPKFASNWKEGADKHTIYPVHVSVQNPGDFRDPASVKKAVDWHIEDAYKRFKARGYADARRMAEENRVGLTYKAKSGTWDFWENPKMWKELGWDGAFMNENGNPSKDALNLAVPKATQQKSIFNKGTYSRTDPRILHSNPPGASAIAGSLLGLEPVDHDPFEQLEPVSGNPFDRTPKEEWKALQKSLTDMGTMTPGNWSLFEPLVKRMEKLEKANPDMRKELEQEDKTAHWKDIIEGWKAQAKKAVEGVRK